MRAFHFLIFAFGLLSETENVKGWWSVNILISLTPYRKCRRFSRAQTIASSFRSLVVGHYYWTAVCDKTAPIPKAIASVV